MGPKEREILFSSAIRMEVAQAEIDEEYLLAFNISAQNCNYQDSCVQWIYTKIDNIMTTGQCEIKMIYSNNLNKFI